MAVMVAIQRNVHEGREVEAVRLIRQMEWLASSYPGYIETTIWRESNHRANLLVLTRWESLDAWRAWEESEDRSEILFDLESLMTTPGVIRTFVPMREETLELAA